MKNAIIILTLSIFGVITSCNEESFLKEKPMSFVSPSEAFVGYEDYNSALNALYDKTRNLYFNNNALQYFNYGTDIGFYGRPTQNNFNNYNTTLNSTTGFVKATWTLLYKIIAQSNTILDRVSDSQLTVEQGMLIEAESKFFRGNAYKVLAHLFGGAPLQLNEVTKPITNYTKVSREDVYNQAISDLLFAAENLPGISEVEDGKLNNLAAYHMLAETYLCVDNFQGAIEAANKVIDHPDTKLMSSRFGTRKDEPGDVYWDLFRRGNQNRTSSGNTESIWVAQYELDVPGGVQRTTGFAQPIMDRLYGAAIRVFSIQDSNGVEGFIPGDKPHEDYGRGVGFLSPTNYFKYTIWASDWNDMRNSNYNVIRDFKLNNPNSEWYGDYLLDHVDMSTRTAVQDTISRWFPVQGKILTVRNYPEGLYRNKELGILTNAAGGTYTDQYIIRLAETYLLRAEAFLGIGDKGNAAVDINILRSRANAINISPDEVDIDFILDERMRELGVEEKRRLTLSRLGLVYDRVSRLNENHPQLNLPGLGIEPFHNLWPIPFVEIERNTEADLEQNPGYSN